jgi:DNA-binding NarL/FixJ family response regulator
MTEEKSIPESTQGQNIRVILVDDHAMIREGLRSLLDEESDIDVVAEAEGGQEAIDLTLKHHPAIVLMDLGMPGINGIKATKEIRTFRPSTKVIILSMYTDEEFVAAAVKNGAVGYVLKQSAASELIKAIREVRKGNTFFSSSISKVSERLPLGYITSGAATQRKLLSVRETEILQLIVDGKTNKEISESLDITIKTVDKHRQNIMDKLDIHNVAGLTKYAMARGMLIGRQK